MSPKTKRKQPGHGHVCRTVGGVPARYIGHGAAMGIDPQTNGLLVDQWDPDGDYGDRDWPLPTDAECAAAAETLNYTHREYGIPKWVKGGAR